MHSHDYRHPDVFEGKHVVILGAAASGQDICLEVATKAELVFLSHKGNVPSKLPDNVKQQRPISFVSTDGTVHFVFLTRRGENAETRLKLLTRQGREPTFELSKEDEYLWTGR